MFDFFIDTYKELVKGEDVESAKKLKKEKEKAEKIIYPKDVKIVTYVLAGFYILVALVSSILTIKFYGFSFSVVSSILLSIIAILIIVFLSRKTKKGEIISIILSVVFALGLYGSLMLSSLFAQMK